MNIEMCFICDEATGNAGVHDGSLFGEDGRGPYCEGCWDGRADIAESRIAELEAEVERLRDTSLVRTMGDAPTDGTEFIILIRAGKNAHFRDGGGGGDEVTCEGWAIGWLPMPGSDAKS